MNIREKLVANAENIEAIRAIAPATIRKTVIVEECARHLATEIWNDRTTLNEAQNRFKEWCEHYMTFKMLAAIFGEKICVDYGKGILWFKHPKKKAMRMPKFA